MATRHRVIVLSKENNLHQLLAQFRKIRRNLNRCEYKFETTCTEINIIKSYMQTKAPRVSKVIWRPPSPGQLKVNTDGAAFGCPVHVGCDGVCRTCKGFIKGCFVIPLGVCFAFEGELVVVVHAIEYVQSVCWRRLWLESDSTYMVSLLRSCSGRAPGCGALFERGVWVILLRWT